ncbi:hypothetical protein HFU84_08660 [Acidithiobacillus sp. CV18-2]|nr:hypothetical protein [Acidithiobacillus sp. CV18-3]MBU2756963.1 hypothetical protein [Acidithiobacillus sp. BN09-2]MBU2777574.1 hypothetical protein [Acidithiobacillus sp. CV18-2]MBU2799674.1 hypothetical protein [Acidithiobacillus sp. VAN18-4]
MIWLLAGSAIKKLAAIPLGLALLHGPLNTPDTWVMGRSAYTPAHAVRLGNSTSANTLQGALGEPVQGVVVDLERWPFTPTQDQCHPVRVMRLGAQRAQRSGKWLLAAPAVDLVKSIRPNYRGRLYQEFMRLGLARRMAPWISAYDIQAQGSERNPRLYASFVRQVVQQLRAANPNITILAGLSTNPTGKSVTLRILEADIALTRSVVNGYWLNVPSPGLACPRCGASRPDLAVRLLREEMLSHG